METTARYRATHLAAILASQGRRRDWLAQQVGVSPGLVSHWLSGRRMLTEERAMRVAAILGTPLFLLFEFSDDSEKLSSEVAA